MVLSKFKKAEKSKMTKQRFSNIELLRIIAMIFILMGHSFLMVNGLPTSADIVLNPIPNFAPFALNAFIVGAVNIYILISGWFGIHYSGKGMGKLLFLFFLYTISSAFISCIQKESICISDLRNALGLVDGYWFVVAYLGLFIISPILNQFAKNSSKEDFKRILICFYAFQTVYSWATGFVNYFSGYSIVFFCGLYLTARYIRKYPIRTLKHYSLIIYITTSSLIAIIAFVSTMFFNHAAHMIRYDNPLVILSSITLFLSFEKMRLNNLFINWLAASAFAVYIIHFNPYVYPFFKYGITRLNSCTSGGKYVTIVMCYLLGVYVICTAIDQLRIVLWKEINKYLNQNKL